MAKKSSRRKGGCCLLVALAAVALFGCLFAVPVLGICPPEGPWPQPPWCVSEIDCVNYPPTVIDDIIRRVTDQIGAQNLKVANGCMFMRSIGDNEFQPFAYEEPDYLPGAQAYPPVERPITFGVCPADYWGNNYLIPPGVADAIPQFARNFWYDNVTLGTDPRKHNNLDNTARRSAQIGAEVFLVEDFIMLVDDDLTMERFDYAGTESMTQSELNRLARAAHESGLEAVLQLTLLDTAFYDLIGEYFNSGQYGSLYDVMTPYQRFDSYNAGEATATLHTQWRAAILEEARMAEEAGFDRLMVTPQGIAWSNTGEYIELDDAEWRATIAAVRQVFSGKLGAGHFTLGQPFDAYTFFEDADFVLLYIQVEQVTAGIAPDDLDGLTAAWQEYLLSSKVAHFGGVPETWQIQIVSSYEGVLDHGWIEPGGHYPDKVSDYQAQAAAYEAFLRALYETPETPINGLITWGYSWHDFIYPNQHEIRDDLSSSIRGKDAENIFYRWTTIFK